jgi:hypothetical protein
MNGHLRQVIVADRDLEAVAEAAQRVAGHLLGLVGDHLAFARFAHAVALDGLGQDQGRLAFVLDGRLVGGKDLGGVVAAAGSAQMSSSLMSATSAGSG